MFANSSYIELMKINKKSMKIIKILRSIHCGIPDLEERKSSSSAA